MASLTVTLHARWAWWVKAYVAGLIITHHLTGLRFDRDKVDYWLRKGLRIETKNEANGKTATIRR